MNGRKTIYEIYQIIKRAMFMSHKGLIFICDLSSVNESPIEKNANLQTHIAIHDDVKKISEFYYRMGYTYYNDSKLNTIIDDGGLIYYAENERGIIAAGIMMTGMCSPHGFSRYVLIGKKGGNIYFDNGVLYNCSIIVDPMYRGNGVYSSLQKYVINHLRNSSFKKIVLITGADNWRMVHSCRNNYELCGIVTIKQLFNLLLIRKTISLNTKNVCWKTVENPRENR